MSWLIGATSVNNGDEEELRVLHSLSQTKLRECFYHPLQQCTVVTTELYAQ